MKSFKQKLLTLAAGALMASGLQAAETVKVGVLHSLSGTMAISETSLKDVLLFTFDEINKSGGVMGKMPHSMQFDDLGRVPAEWWSAPGAAEPETGDEPARVAIGELAELRSEVRALRELVADQAMELHLLKSRNGRTGRPGGRLPIALRAGEELGRH